MYSLFLRSTVIFDCVFDVTVCRGGLSTIQESSTRPSALSLRLTYSLSSFGRYGSLTLSHRCFCSCQGLPSPFLDVSPLRTPKLIGIPVGLSSLRIFSTFPFAIARARWASRRTFFAFGFSSCFRCFEPFSLRVVQESVGCPTNFQYFVEFFGREKSCRVLVELVSRAPSPVAIHA